MLETLNKKQLKLIDKKRDEWLKFAFGGDRFIASKFYKGIDFIYSISNLKSPIKIYVDSPLGTQYACVILRNLKGQQVWQQV